MTLPTKVCEKVGLSPASIATAVHIKVSEGKMAEAAFFLFCVKKMCWDCWFASCSELFRRTNITKRLSSYYTLREATTSDDIDVVMSHFPGVRSFVSPEKDYKDWLIQLQEVL